MHAPGSPVLTPRGARCGPGTPVQRIHTPRSSGEPVGPTRSSEPNSVAPSPASTTRVPSSPLGASTTRVLGSPLGAPAPQMRKASSPLPCQRTPRSMAAPPPQVSREAVSYALPGRSVSPARCAAGPPLNALTARSQSPGALRRPARSPSPSGIPAAPPWPPFAAGQLPPPLPQQAPPAAHSRSFSPCSTSFMVAPALGRAGSFQPPGPQALRAPGASLPVGTPFPDSTAVSNGGSHRQPCSQAPTESSQGGRAQSPSNRGPTQRKRWLQDIVGSTLDSSSSSAAPSPPSSSLANLARNAMGGPQAGAPPFGLRR